MLKKIKSLFIIEEESDTNSSTGSESGGSAPQQSKTTVSAGSGSVKGSKGKVNQKFINILLEAMDGNDLEGFDYLEFKQFLKSLGNMQMDEETKFKSAFATAQTMGATLDVLKNSAQHYLDILKNERAKFDEAVEKRRSHVLAEQKKRIEKLKEDIRKKEEQIEKLKQQIATSQKNVETKTEEITKSEEKVERTSAEFIQAYSLLVGQIENDVRKIDKFLS